MSVSLLASRRVVSFGKVRGKNFRVVVRVVVRIRIRVHIVCTSGEGRGKE
jgi:hypothetical protein